ncbi:MAG: sugar ABC transporter substrate-binding protein [Lachnospiraceae bacterium]|uniref:Sugar ABC transporter substrate-binding protein n=1 Tax=Candidatus Weimeria bifida TaxID=2599074 RepID=A0A6N7IZM7_9FIRM|nr:sugar ABC transporter substrate-binding protein [Candidatus Weimeria bifida]RRF96533.1 MAG: sugar ABC transporter substrate-binding protein [Lachnospiraceae bacterium]
MPEQKKKQTVRTQISTVVNDKPCGRIGVIFYTPSTSIGPSRDAFFNDVYNGIVMEAARFDEHIEVVRHFSQMNATDQSRDIEAMAKSGIKGLIVAPIADPLVAETLRKVSEKGIPVVTVHTDIENSGRIAYVGTDPYKAGKAAAAQMCQICDADTEVGIVTGFRRIKVHEERIRGFMDYLKDNPKNLTVDSIGECRDEDYKAYEIVQKMKTDHPGISAFFFATTNGVYGGCRGIFTMTTRLKFHVITLGVYDSTREYIRKGLIDCAVYQNPLRQGIDAVRILADKVFEGREPENEITYEELAIKTPECLYL